MRKLIREATPSHNIFGEEEGFHEGSPAVDSDTSSYLWVLDPIDGTKSFITGELFPTSSSTSSIFTEPIWIAAQFEDM